MSNPTNQQIRDKQLQDYLAERKARNPKLTPSITYTNASTSGSYTGNRMGSARAGADQHFQFLSCGPRAQIVRT